MRGRGGLARERVDRVDDARPRAAGKIVSHARDDEQLRAGDRGSGVMAAFDVRQWIGVAVDHERRRRDRAQRLLAVAARDDRRQLAGDAWRMKGAVERALRPAANAVLLE